MGNIAAFFDIDGTLYRDSLMVEHFKKLIKYEIIDKKDKTLILVATSGDTGKAALEGFKNVEGTDIIVFYPEDGVSVMQKLQMQTQEGDNVYVCGINGNFDDAQKAVKHIFTSDTMKNSLKELGYSLSSANSINWGRLVPQIVYYFSAYVDLVSNGNISLGDKINFAVPCGNFGNILAGYYAKLIGLPINKLICASNENKVLTDFFNTGVYDVNRPFHKTISPSMDILISSNLERLLFEMSGRNPEFVNEAMQGLSDNGKYKVDLKLLDDLGIEAGFANESDTKMAIDCFFDNHNYPLDTHTAVAVTVYNDYVARTGDETPTVIIATASPFKFPVDVYNALSHESVKDDFAAAKKLKYISDIDIPQQIQSLLIKPIIHNNVINKDIIDAAVLGYIRGKYGK
ncbi:MAG: threonine synthase [Clostridia bacterium]